MFAKKEGNHQQNQPDLKNVQTNIAHPNCTSLRHGLTEGEQRHVEYFGPEKDLSALEQHSMNPRQRQINFKYFGTIWKKLFFAIFEILHFSFSSTLLWSVTVSRFGENSWFYIVNLSQNRLGCFNFTMQNQEFSLNRDTVTLQSRVLEKEKCKISKIEKN